MTREEAIKHIITYAYYDDDIPLQVATALDMAISALRQQEQESKPTNGWISVKDRLPETDGIYIVCDCQLNGNPWIHTAGFIKASSSWCEEHGVYYDDRYGRYSEQDKITHWQPMPAPPEM